MSVASEFMSYVSALANFAEQHPDCVSAAEVVRRFTTLEEREGSEAALAAAKLIYAHMIEHDALRLFGIDQDRGVDREEG